VKHTENTKGQPDLKQVALFGLCPNCGERTLFSGMLKFAQKCRSCGFDIGQFNVGDGPAAILILVIGGFITASAVIFQLKFDPPFWVHMLLWIPLTIIAVIASLRLTKAALLALEYRNSAGEAQFLDEQGNGS